MVAEIDIDGIEVKDGKIRLSHKNRAGEEIERDYKISLENGRYSFRKMTPVEIERFVIFTVWAAFHIKKPQKTC